MSTETAPGDVTAEFHRVEKLGLELGLSATRAAAVALTEVCHLYLPVSEETKAVAREFVETTLRLAPWTCPKAEEVARKFCGDVCALVGAGATP
jgi:hypothetical protein